MRRRLPGIRKMIKITFRGNGGVTSEGKDTVTETVFAGTTWKNVLKPDFLLSAVTKQQNGFTSVQGDDDTLIGPDYVITGDMTVYASYTVVETGIITHAGEVMSVQRWIDKYGKVTDEAPTGCFVIQGPDQSGTGYKIDVPAERRQNLVRYFYIKTSNDKAFAYSVGFKNEDNAYIGAGDDSMPYGLGGDGLLDEFLGVPGFYIPESTEIRDLYNYSNIRWGVYPEMFRPSLSYPVDYDSAPKEFPSDGFSRMFLEENGDGEAMTEIYRNIVVNAGGSSPAIDFIRTWPLPPSVTRKFYVPTIYDMRIYEDNIQKIYDHIISPLEEWSDDFASVYTFRENVSPHNKDISCYSYYEEISGNNYANRRVVKGFLYYAATIGTGFANPVLNMFRKAFSMNMNGIRNSDTLYQFRYQLSQSGYDAIGYESGNSFQAGSGLGRIGLIIPCNVIELFE
ncbi:MAG: hypothetical protein LBL33_08715 [Tannerella sp.]|nr:hypothetical protein [Tannerella sp.]